MEIWLWRCLVHDSKNITCLSGTCPWPPHSHLECSYLIQSKFPFRCTPFTQKAQTHGSHTCVCMWAYARVNPCVCMCVTFPSVYDCTQTDFVLPVLSYFSEESSPVIPDSKAPAVAQPVPTRLTSCFPYWTLSLSDSWANRERDPRTMSTAQYSFRRDFFLKK